jgi:hypothetical protein
MNAQLVDLQYSGPLLEGEYRVTVHDDGTSEVQHARYEGGRFHWHPAFLLDTYADTARAAFKLATNLIKAGFTTQSLLPVQFTHLSANLAVRLHKLHPLSEHHGMAEQALMTMCKIAQQPVADCVGHLITAGLLPDDLFAVQAQELIQLSGHFTPDLNWMYQQRNNSSQFDAACVQVLVRQPHLLLQMKHLRVRTLRLIEQLLRADTGRINPIYQPLTDLLYAPSADNQAKNNLQLLQSRLHKTYPGMELFSVSIITADVGVGSEKFRMASHDRELDQAMLAGEFASAQIIAGRYELVDHRRLPVFRCQSQGEPPHTLTSIVLRRIDGLDPTPDTVNEFCRLFNLSFATDPINVASYAQ